MKSLLYIIESLEMQKQLSFKIVDKDYAYKQMENFPEKYNLIKDIGNVDTFDKNNSKCEELSKSKMEIYEILLNGVSVGYIGIHLVPFNGAFLPSTINFDYNKHNNIFNEIKKFFDESDLCNSNFLDKYDIDKQDFESYYKFIINKIVITPLMHLNIYISFLDINYDNIKLNTKNFSPIDFINTIFSYIKSNLIYQYNFDYDSYYKNFAQHIDKFDIINCDNIINLNYNKYVKDVYNKLNELSDSKKYTDGIQDIMIIRNVFADIKNKIKKLVKQQINNKELYFITTYPKDNRIKKMYIRGGFEEIEDDPYDGLIYWLTNADKK